MEGRNGIKNMKYLPFKCSPIIFSLSSLISLSHTARAVAVNLIRAVCAFRAQGWDSFLLRRASCVLGTLIEILVNVKDS